MAAEANLGVVPDSVKSALAWRGARARERRWQRWALVAVIVVVAYVVVISLLPSSVLNTFHHVEENSNGILQVPNGQRETR